MAETKDSPEGCSPEQEVQGTDQPCRAQGHEELGLYAEQGSTSESSKWENN